MRTQVECNECGHTWVSGFKLENIKAGKCVCKGDGCDSTDIKIIGPAKPVKPDVNETAEQREARQSKARKNRVDEKNAEHAIDAESEEDALAKVPLNQAERDFCTNIAAKMSPKDNKGNVTARRGVIPAAADILRYSKLKKRLNV